MLLSYDCLGSVTDITNSNGETIESFQYDAYGLPNHTSTIGNRFYFTSREFDAETGLYYYRARYYNPTIGRFLQRDPLGHLPDVNVYRYVKNNPINFIDPLGLDKQKDSRGAWYFDIGYSGFGPSPSHPGVNVGIQIGSQGFNFYWGVGLGYGWAATATFHPSQTLPSAGTKVSIVGRIGLEGFGIKAAGSLTQEGVSGRVGFGVGIGAGVATTATQTIRIFTWDWD